MQGDGQRAAAGVDAMDRDGRVRPWSLGGTAVIPAASDESGRSSETLVGDAVAHGVFGSPNLAVGRGHGAGKHPSREVDQAIERRERYRLPVGEAP